MIRLLMCLSALALVGAALPSPTGPTLAAAGAQFTLDGQETFLLGVSLFDALGATPPRDEDLNALQRWGVKVVRVWAHWSVPIYDRDGSLTPDGRARLAALVGRLRSRGILLELVLLRPGQLPGQKDVAFSSADARVRAVTSITTTLLNDRDVLFDLFNEHDHAGGPISHRDARRLRDAVKAVDPQRLVTISSTGTHLITPAGTVRQREEQNVREEVGRGPGDVGVDILAPHLPRSGDWAAATDSRVAILRSALDRANSAVPIYLSEENRHFPGRAIAPVTYVRAATGARAARAAGWMFHTEAGFALGARPFLAALTPSERAALEQLSDKIRAFRPK
ncbi:MAG: hypothetical protein A3F69_02405 [Acidobacteria bacterium RIFCSPLOWO2_12_FULL_66_10]|nr:MAG: hypothetical protein A3F69_02405 [Acidobacteria bacterium RIFCSPLOWO2_12_FULL_66_10]